MKINTHPYYRKGIQLPHFLHDVAAERITNHSRISQPGHNQTIGAAWELVYAKSQAYTWLTSADTLHVLSDNGADGPAGVGARTVYIWGLDANWQQISETITMNGVTAVASALKYLRVLGAYVVTAGNNGQNSGNISIMNSTETWTLQYIEAIFNRALATLYAVPAGHNLYITEWYCAETTGSATEFALYKREFGGLFQFTRCVHVRNQGMALHLEVPKRIPARSDFAILCYHSEGTGSGCAGFGGWIEPA